MSDYLILGKALPLVDSVPKMTGPAVFSEYVVRPRYYVLYQPWRSPPMQRGLPR